MRSGAHGCSRRALRVDAGSARITAMLLYNSPVSGNCYRALGALEAHLEGSGDYVVGRGLTRADIVLYAYTHVAHEGGFSLDGYPAIRGWLGRVAAEPGHVPITA
jgi:glutathione S-transferase